MASTFPPQKDADLYTMSSAFSTKISATPTAYGLTAAQATAYAALNTAYGTAYNTAINPTTRTKANIATKDLARANLIGLANGLRDLNRFVQATRSVTDAQKIELGLPVYASRTPIPAPVETPVISIASSGPWTMMLHLRQSGATHRSFPSGVSTAYVFSSTAAVAPTNVKDWHFEGSTSKPDVPIAFDPAIAGGTKVWLTACYLSPRQQPGPLADPISGYILGGVGGLSAEAA